MKRSIKIINAQRVASCAIFLGLIAAPFATALAAKPGGGTTPVPVDVAYMSASGGGYSVPGMTAVRGMAITAAGTATADVALWKSAPRFASSITWSPDGSSLAWVEEIARGTRALMVAKPGESSRAVFRFSNPVPRWDNRLDGLAWGRGCNGTSVIVFVGVSAEGGGFHVIDPLATTPSPKLLYTRAPPPPQPIPGPGMHGFAFSPRGGHLAFVEYSEQMGRYNLVALPLTCTPGNGLPVIAGPAQPLYPAEYDGSVGWAHSLDWSSDGRKLAVSMGRFEVVAGVGNEYPARIWVGELNYVVAGDIEQVTAAAVSLQRVTAEAEENSDGFASWAPTPPLDACDRFAFSRRGEVVLLDIPRDGFASTDCAIAVPTSIGGTAVGSLDWK